MAKFNLEIMTPDKIFLKCEAEMVTITTTDGERGILAKHIPTIYTVQPGIAKINKDGQILNAVLTEGLMSVTGDKVTITVDAAEWPEEIDKARSEAALKRAKDRISEKKNDKINQTRAEAALKRAAIRIKASDMKSGLNAK